MFKKLFATNNDAVLTFLRISLGLIMFPHGAQKVLGWFGGYGYSATMDAFTGMMGIPAPLAFLAFMAEFLGSIFLIFGLFTRVSAFGIGMVMLVAAFKVHWPLFFMNWSGQQAGEGIEYHLLAIAIAVALAIKGGGAASIDRALTSRNNLQT